MKEKKEKSEFKLSESIKVQYKMDGKNDFLDIDTIYFQAPSPKEKDICRGLKKKFMEAIASMTASISRDEAQKRVGNQDETEMDSKAIKAILFMAKDFDLNDYFSRFSVLLERVAFKNEEMTQKLIRMEFDKIDENDFEDLIAKYIEDFFIVSWMRTLA